MAHPQAKHIVTTVFVGTAAILGIFLLATVNRHSPFVPWSTAHLNLPGVKGSTKFGLMSLDNCVNDRCNTHDYDWLAKYTKLWHSDTSGCQQASRTIVGLMSVGTIGAIVSTALAVAQLLDQQRAKTVVAVNTNAASMLVTTVMFVAAAGVWVGQCNERLEETTTTTLSWGFAMAVIAAGLTFTSLLVELLTPAPWGEANVAGGQFVASSTGPLLGTGAGVSSSHVTTAGGPGYSQL